MYDANAISTKYKEPLVLHGRFTGAGTGTPAALTTTTQGATLNVTSKGLTISRSNTGALTVTVSDLPVGILQYCNMNVLSAANAKQVLVPPPGALANTFAVQVVWSGNTANVDVSANEELDVELWFARTQVP
jgi:hypothetical protein